MAADLPYFPLYVDDLLSDEKVMAMNTLQFGAYMRLLCLAWKGKPCGSIPSDDAILARMAGLSTAEWDECKPRVLDCFKRGADDRYHQKRMEQVYRQIIGTKRQKSEGGRLGAQKRWASKKRAPPGDDGIPNGIPISKPMGSLFGSGSGYESSPKKRTKKGKGGAGEGGDVDSPPLPPELDTPEFREAWKRWVAYRREKRKPLTPSTVQQQLADMAKWGAAAAVQSILTAIRNGWQGVFEPGRQTSYGRTDGTPTNPYRFTEPPE